jgi:hypothetical protein
MCDNFSLDQGYALKCLFGTCLIAIYLVILPTRQSLFACPAAALAPTLLLMVVANDIGRWLMLPVFCAWLLSALIVIRHTGRIAASPRSTVTGAAAFGVILALGYTPYNDVNLAAREVIAAHWPNTVHSLEEWLTRCDAAWLSVVYPLELRPEGELLVTQERRYRGRRGSDLIPDEPGVKAHAHPQGGVAREADIDASS